MGMKKLKASTSSSNRGPSFFKVMIGDFDEKLQEFFIVCTSFVNLNMLITDPRARLLVLDQGDHLCSALLDSSLVKPKYSNQGKGEKNDIESGYQRVLSDISMGSYPINPSLEVPPGDLGPYKYNGKSKFNVKIYGRTGCEKEVHFNHEEPKSDVKKEKEVILCTGENPEPRKPVMETEKKAGAVIAASSIKTKRQRFIAIWRHSRKYHLTIPRALAIENGLETKRSIVLQDPEGRSWPVIISRRPDGRIDMTNGWPQFWKGNRLEVGDTCLFEFLNQSKGNKLSVRIFRKAEVKKPARLLLSKRSTSTATLNLLNCNDDSTEEVKAAPGSVIPTALSPCSQYLGFELKKGKFKLPKTKYVTTLAEERAIKAASAFESENPFCMIIMRPSYVHDPCTVNIPSKFAKAHLMKKTQIVTLRVSNGRKWQVRCSCSEHHTKLVKGWKDFVSDNNLEEGDVCIFELVSRKIFKMNVSIFRVSRDVV
ncbi:B3 DNA binding domain [Macleaya cordata]|uniref:B3 DNA binding domain n=1 Tax=Macleaya cordata TaxID=56857 RepID=A0A200Q3X5_MACCD|nr:B3 DNA binding domain [Macleaya cordata]